MLLYTIYTKNVYYIYIQFDQFALCLSPSLSASSIDKLDIYEEDLRRQFLRRRWQADRGCAGQPVGNAGLPLDANWQLSKAPYGVLSGAANSIIEPI